MSFRVYSRSYDLKRAAKPAVEILFHYYEFNIDRKEFKRVAAIVDHTFLEVSAYFIYLFLAFFNINYDTNYGIAHLNHNLTTDDISMLSVKDRNLAECKAKASLQLWWVRVVGRVSYLISESDYFHVDLFSAYNSHNYDLYKRLFKKMPDEWEYDDRPDDLFKKLPDESEYVYSVNYVINNIY